MAKIVAGFNERIANEPKVSFRDGHYYVFDGQHTIVARKHMNGNNDLPILCKVYYGMTEAEEALLFAMQTGYSSALTPSARLRANLRGEDKASGEFYAATEEAGLHMGFERGGGVGRILCINTAFAEFRRAGAELYKEALTILLEAWGGDPDSLRAEVIRVSSISWSYTAASTTGSGSFTASAAMNLSLSMRRARRKRSCGA